MKFKILSALAVASLTVGLCVDGVASAYGPNAPVITTNTNTTPPGGSVTVSGSGFAPDATITITITEDGSFDGFGGFGRGRGRGRFGAFAADFSTVLGTTISTGTGTFSTPETIPADFPPGLYTITAKDSDGDSASTEILVQVQTYPPVITSGNSASDQVGHYGSFQVTATGYPAPTFSESGRLPGGVGFSSSGELAGTPRAGSAGNYYITITARNSVGYDSQRFDLTVTQPNVAPLITSPGSASGTVGQFGSFQVTATGYPAPTFGEHGALPAGVGFGSSGELAGTPRPGSAGTYSFEVYASNSAGTATQRFNLSISNPAPPPPVHHH